MFLKRVEIAGFKSFARKTVMEFSKGITAVVGPNGSGKSNVIDAVRWVLGEQSAKVLRGAKMEEVIFGGSDRKGSLSLAEVTVVFDNTSRRLPLEFEEVAVTRRIDKSGSSEYFLNNSSCRLKEIVDLFMGTGIGHGTYCIIGSDEVDLLLSSNPFDRRMIIEEVAAVNKYKYKKKEAGKKLEQTQQNLVRIHDLRVEVLAQLSGLSSQKDKAQKYFELKKEIDELTITLILDTLASFDKRRAQMVAAKDGLEQKRLEKEEAVKGVRNELEQLDELLRAARTGYGALQAKQEEIRLLFERKQGERNLLKEKLVHGNSFLQKLTDEIGESKKRSGELDVEEMQIKEELAVKMQLLQSLHEELLGRREALEAIDERDKERRSRYEECAARYKELENSVTREERVQSEFKERLTAKNEEQDRVNGDVTRCQDAAFSLKAEWIQINEVKNSRQKSALALASSLKDLENNLLNKEEHKDSLQGDLNSLKGSYEVAKERLKLLQDLETSLAGFSEGTKAALKWGEKEPGIIGALGTLMEVDTGYEQALDVALGRHIQDIVVETHEIAEKAIDFLKKDKKGRATFLPLTFFQDQSKVPPSAEVPFVKEDMSKLNQDGFVAYAVDVVKCSPRLRPIINRLLGKIVVFKSLSLALLAAKQGRTNGYDGWRERGFTIVTLDGEFIAHAGTVTGGSVKKERDTVFGRQRGIKDLKKSLEEMAVQESSLQNDLLSCNQELKHILEEKNELKTKFEAQEQLVSISERELVVLKTREEHSQDEEKRLVTRKDTLEQEIEKLSVELTGKEEMIFALKRDLHLKEEEMAAAATSLEAGKEERENIKNSVHSIEIKMAQEEEIQRGLERRLSDFIAQQREYIVLVQTKEREIEELKGNLEELTKEESVCEEVIKELTYKEEETRGKQGVLEEKIAKTEGELGRANISIGKLLKEEERFKERRHEIELQLTILDTQKQQEVDRLTRDFPHVPPQGISYEGEIKELEKALEEKQTAQYALGPVNFSAVEDYNRLDERHIFLAGQETDLTEARSNLEKMISDLDEQSIKQFKETFEALNAEFGNIFTDMFKGGKGALRLTNPDNLLESGVDVLAQPPGKKTQNLHLLSSGEKALTGIAFLLAILRVKPSPFCLLDEVDASLDDANIDRFSKKLEEYSHASQFIVVTHNRKTMQTANTLYGVTMDEPGVSKIMSLRLDEVCKEDPHELVYQS